MWKEKRYPQEIRKGKRTGIVFFIYGAYGDWCVYPCACTALPVHTAAFIHDPFRAHFREQERSGLRGGLCSSRFVGSSRFYAGRRAGIYFPAYFRLSFGIHRGSLAHGEIVGAYGKTVIFPHLICEPGRTSCGLPFWNGLCIYHK